MGNILKKTGGNARPSNRHVPKMSVLGASGRCDAGRSRLPARHGAALRCQEVGAGLQPEVLQVTRWRGSQAVPPLVIEGAKTVAVVGREWRNHAGDRPGQAASKRMGLLRISMTSKIFISPGGRRLVEAERFFDLVQATVGLVDGEVRGREAEFVGEHRHEIRVGILAVHGVGHVPTELAKELCLGRLV